MLSNFNKVSFLIFWLLNLILIKIKHKYESVWKIENECNQMNIVFT